MIQSVIGTSFINKKILVLTFDDINNVTNFINFSGDAYSLEDWNQFFDLPTYGTPFTSVEVNGNQVSLIDGGNIIMRESLFDGSDSLIEVDDSFGCVIELEYNVFGDSENGGSYNLVSVNFPNVTVAGDYCFYYCESLTTINLPRLTTVGDDCFESCESLTTINLPRLTTAGYYCFYSCQSLTTVDLPKLTTVGDYCFYSCQSLTTVDLPKLTTVGESCFYECTSLTTINLPLCTDLGGTPGDDNVFYNISGNNIVATFNSVLLTNNGGNIDGDIQYLGIFNNLTINNQSYEPFTGYEGNLTIEFNDIENADILVGDSSNVEDWNIFFNLPSWSTQFSSVIVDGNEITLIGGENILLRYNIFDTQPLVSFIDQGCVCYVSDQCFYTCQSLVSVSLPQLLFADDECFSYCSSLTTVDLPQLVTAADSCFSQCLDLITINLPALTTVGDSCFNYCISLVNVSLPSLTTAGDQCFSQCLDLITINLPQLTTVGGGFFQACTSLTTVDLPALTTVENFNFLAYCTSLVNVSLPALTTVQIQCFLGCTSLTTVSLPSLTTAGDQCFNGCTSLTTVSLPSLTTAGGSFFYQCTSLTTVDLPSLVTVGNQFFYQCTSLAEVSIPLCTDLGSSVLNNDVFFGIIGNTILFEVNPVLLTFNNGEGDHDLLTLSYVNDVTINGEPYQPFTGYTGNLTLGFTNISGANALVGDATSVSDWNTFLDLPTWSTPFTSVSVVGNDVTLIGGENIGLLANKFLLKNTLLSVDDQGCVASIGNGCFSNCNSLTSVSLPLLRSGDNSCLFSCRSLETLSLPLLQTAGPFFLSACDSLETISLPELQSTGLFCFGQCTSLETISLPELQSAGMQCFQDCTSLTSISLPSCTILGESVENNQVFSNIVGITISLTIPASLMTCNSGNPDGDIQYLQANNTVTITQV